MVLWPLTTEKIMPVKLMYLNMILTKQSEIRELFRKRYNPRGCDYLNYVKVKHLYKIIRANKNSLLIRNPGALKSTKNRKGGLN